MANFPTLSSLYYNLQQYIAQVTAFKISKPSINGHKQNFKSSTVMLISEMLPTNQV